MKNNCFYAAKKKELLLTVKDEHTKLRLKIKFWG